MPNRYFKESLLSSQSVAMLSLGAQAFLTRLILVCDDYGRQDARPALLRSLCFPLQVEQISLEQISGWLQEMQQARPRPEDPPLIEVYETDGKAYLYFPHWARHNPPRAKTSKFPHPPEPASTCMQTQADASACSHMSPYSGPGPYSSSKSSSVAGPGPEPPAAAIARDALGEIAVLYESNFGMLNPLIGDKLKDMLAEYGETLTRDALTEAGTQPANKRHLNYVAAILKRWAAEGRGPPGNNGNGKKRDTLEEDLKNWTGR